ncbi:DUF6923 family protein, partial [Microbacterium sp. NPDC090003]|uniref:DUF6923 family protein n=1 Tax=Microbacterium sp. NPDC090003 TaxID=3364203 RepID=UPI00380F9287
MTQEQHARPPGRWRRRALKVGAGVAVAGLAIMGGISAANAAAGDPWPTDKSQIWLLQSGTGPTGSLYDVNYSGASGKYDFDLLAAISPGSLSSMAFNPDDGFIYALSSSGSRTIYRIAQGGVVTTMPSLLAPSPGAWSGMEYHDGKLWFYSTGGTRITSLDLATGAEVVHQFTSSIRNDSPNDLVYANGYFWSASSAGYLLRYDVSTNTVTRLSAPALTAGTTSNYGAAWVTGSGLLGFVDNFSGRVVHVRVSGAGVVEVIGAGQANPTYDNDGAYNFGTPADIALKKTGPVEFMPGESFEYSFTVSNVGSSLSGGWFLKDVLPAGLGSPVLVDSPGVTMTTQTGADGSQTLLINGGELAAGEEITFRVRVTAASDIRGCVTNTAELIGMEDDPEYGNNTSSTDCAQVVTARLALDKEVSSVIDVNSNGITDPGDQIFWRFKVSNTGIANIENIAIRDELLQTAGVDVTCTPLALAPGQSADCESTEPYVITADDAKHGAVENTAVATGNVPPGQPGDPGNVESPEDSTETPVEEPESNVNAAASASASAKADDASNPSAQVAAQAAATP